MKSTQWPSIDIPIFSPRQPWTLQRPSMSSASGWTWPRNMTSSSRRCRGALTGRSWCANTSWRVRTHAETLLEIYSHSPDIFSVLISCMLLPFLFGAGHVMALLHSLLFCSSSSFTPNHCKFCWIHFSCVYVGLSTGLLHATSTFSTTFTILSSPFISCTLVFSFLLLYFIGSSSFIFAYPFISRTQALFLFHFLFTYLPWCPGRGRSELSPRAWPRQ